MKNRTIRFEAENHTYQDERNLFYTSVTTLIGKFHDKFDKEFWSYYKAYSFCGYETQYRGEEGVMYLKAPNSNSLSKLVKTTKANAISKAPNNVKFKAIALKESWDVDNKVSCAWGSKTHDTLEFGINTFYKGREKTTYALRDKFKLDFDRAFKTPEDLYDSSIAEKFPTIFNYLLKLIHEGYTIYTEVLIYHPDNSYLVCGTADVVAIRDNDVIVADWKTNKSTLTKKAGYYKKKTDPVTFEVTYTDQFIATNKNMHKPIDHIPDSDYWHYALQLSLYAYLISLFGYNIVKLELWHLVPAYTVNGKMIMLDDGERVLGHPQYHKLPFLIKEVAAMIETTKIEVSEN